MASSTAIMLNCIKWEIFGWDKDKAFWETVTPEEWKDVLSLSQKHDLSHIIGNFVLKNNFISDAELKAAYNKQTLTAYRRYSMQDGEITAIRSLFEKEKIPFIVLKGPVLRRLYPEEWLRPSCDIDILVHKNALEKAKGALIRQLHYTVQAVRYHDVSLFSPSGVHLELHFSVLENQKNLDTMLAKVWDYAVPISKESAERQLTAEYFIFYITAHLCHHFIDGGCGIKPFIDIRLLSEKAEYDTAALRCMLETAGISTFFDAMLRLSDVWFGNAEYDNSSRNFEEYILKGGVYGTIENRMLSTQSQVGKWKAFFRKLFPSYASLCMKYPNRNIKKWQIPYYCVKKWFDMIKNNSAQKNVRKIKAFAETTSDDLDKTKQMLKDLDLL